MEELDVEVFGAGLLVVVALRESRRGLVTQVRVLGPEERYRAARLSESQTAAEFRKVKSDTLLLADLFMTNTIQNFTND